MKGKKAFCFTFENTDIVGIVISITSVLKNVSKKDTRPASSGSSSAIFCDVYESMGDISYIQSNMSRYIQDNTLLSFEFKYFHKCIAWFSRSTKVSNAYFSIAILT